MWSIWLPKLKTSNATFLVIFVDCVLSILTVFVPFQKHPFLVFNQWNPLFRPQIWSSLTRLNWRDDPLSTATFEPILIPESPMHFKPSERKSPQLWIALKMTLPLPTETKSFWPWPTFWAVSLSKKNRQIASYQKYRKTKSI